MGEEIATVAASVGEATNAIPATIQDAKTDNDAINWIGGQLAAADSKEAAQAQEAPATDVAADEIVEGAEFPKEFVDLASSLGLTEEQIQSTFSGMSDADLKELSAVMQAEDEVPDIAPEAEAAAKPEGKNDGPDLAAIREEITKEVLAKLSPQFAEVKTMKQEMRRRSAERALTTANDAFDKASKEFPVFGETKELPVFPAGPMKGRVVPAGPAYKARAEVFEVANALVKAGRSLDDAMTDAIAWYRGRHGQQQVQRNLIKSLQDKEQKLSGMRTGKEIKRTFADKRDEGIDFVRSLMQSKGA
jgi:hypothetical protein